MTVLDGKTFDLPQECFADAPASNGSEHGHSSHHERTASGKRAYGPADRIIGKRDPNRPFGDTISDLCDTDRCRSESLRRIEASKLDKRLV